MMHEREDPGSPPALTELEGRLRGADGGALRESLQQQLSDVETRLRRQMAAGMPRLEFADWRHALSAVVAARAVIDHLPAAPTVNPSSIIEGLRRRDP